MMMMMMMMTTFRVCVCSREIELLTGEKQECEGRVEKLKTHQIVLQNKCVPVIITIMLDQLDPLVLLVTGNHRSLGRRQLCTEIISSVLQ